MKVWLLLSRLDFGGLERVQINLAQAMRARGVEVSLIAGKIVGNAQRELPPDLPILELARASPWLFPIALLRSLRRALPDVVFTTSNDVACLVLVLRLVFFHGLRVVVTQHLALSPPRKSAKGLKRAKLNFIRMMMRLLLPTADHIVAVSEGVAQDMRRELSLPNLNIRTIYNPIVAPHFEFTARPLPQWPWTDPVFPTIIFVGRLSAEKRLDLLLDSFESLARIHSCRLLIVGTGPLQESVKWRIKSRGLEKLCHLAGFIDDPLPMIAASTVLALTSDYEGFGNVLVEAMACGTQIVSTNCPFGPAEILNHGQFGQLVPVGDRDALEAALIRALQGQFHVPSNVLKARARHFTIDTAVNQYMSLLHRE